MVLSVMFDVLIGQKRMEITGRILICLSITLVKKILWLGNGKQVMSNGRVYLKD